MWDQIQCRHFLRSLFQLFLLPLIFKCTCTCFQGTPPDATIQSRILHVLKLFMHWSVNASEIFESQFRFEFWKFSLRQFLIEKLFFWYSILTTWPHKLRRCCEIQCSCMYPCQIMYVCQRILAIILAHSWWKYSNVFRFPLYVTPVSQS